jgi:HSP20 family protein
MEIVRNGNGPVQSYRPVSDPFDRFVDRMFQDFLGPVSRYAGAGREGEGLAAPRINVSETDGAYEVEAEMPGVPKENVKVAIDKNRVSIEAEIRSQPVDANKGSAGSKQLHAERYVRRYQRSFTLPVELDDAGAQARMEHGVLLLRLPKKQAAQPKQIQVQ